MVEELYARYVSPPTWQESLLDYLLPRATRSASSQQRRPYAVLHRAGQPRLLIPLHNRRVSAATFSHYPSDLPTRQRLQRLAVAAGVRLGLVQPFLRPKRDAYVNVSIGPPSAATRDLHAYLAEALGVADVVTAFTLGPPRPNQKPIAHLFDPRGRLLAVGKIGVNALTSRLVRHEADFLTAVPRDRLRRLRIPRVLHADTWQGWTVTLLEPLPVPRGLRVPHSEPSVAEVREVAALGTCSSVSLAESPYCSNLGARIAAVTDTAAAKLAARALEDALEEAGELIVAHGAWHGDWTPWNMAPRGGQRLVWDWERAGGDRPVGFDILHYHFQMALLKEHVPAEALLRVTLWRCREVLLSLGVDESHHRVLLSLYVIELYLRYVENQEDGVPEQAVSRVSTVRQLLLGQ